MALTIVESPVAMASEGDSTTTFFLAFLARVDLARGFEVVVFEVGEVGASNWIVDGKAQSSSRRACFPIDRGGSVDLGRFGEVSGNVEGRLLCCEGEVNVGAGE